MTSPLRILVVDDQRGVLHAARVLLGSAGHAVHTAETGAAALELARRVSPQVVLSDLQLPGAIDGESLARALRSDSQRDLVFLCALTGSADREARASAMRAGFDEVLVKPLDFAAFLDRLAALTGAGRDTPPDAC